MNDYIRRKDAYKYLTIREPWKLDSDDIHSRITSIPSADVVEVKHGKWIENDDEYNHHKCSICGEISCCTGNYCPNCGADMRDK